MKVKFLPTHYHMKVWTLSLTFFISLIIAIFSGFYSIPKRRLTARWYPSTFAAKIFSGETKINPNTTSILNYILNKHILPPSRKPYNLTSSISYSDDVIHRESRLFEKLGINNGIFVEYRAFDGLQASHTLNLELNASWTGLLIEPSPVLFQQLKNRHRLAWIANVCVSVYYPTMVYISGNQEDLKYSWEDGTQTIYPPLSYRNSLLKIENDDDDEHLYYKVECFPLSSILWAMNITSIDFLTLQLDEHEFRVLEAFPFHTIHIKVVTLRHQSVPPENKDKIKMLMKRKGYECIYQNSKYFLFLHRRYYSHLNIFWNNNND
ncbi:unnamed protein product [Orchesella dallaii]|uniref:Methyltransferase FkbM domain-containing protein n=1 Tax=Orchesella dallaii TaxID=48710 RepID=A0ABP1S3V4_9HEXA